MPQIDIKLEQIPEGSPLRLECAGTAVVVVRTPVVVAAFPDVCPHARWRLSDGKVGNGVLECPGHGWEFDLATGGCLTVPAYRLKPLSVVVSAGNVRITWDDPAADPG